MSTPEPSVRVTRYEVSCLPEDHIDAFVWTIAVEYRGAGRWAATERGAYLDADGGKSWGFQWENGREPVTDEEFESYRRAHDAWLDAHRFDLETALRIAREQAPKITVNGWTVEKVLAHDAAGEAGR